MGGHHKAKNWGCPDTVDTNGSSPMFDRRGVSCKNMNVRRGWIYCYSSPCLYALTSSMQSGPYFFLESISAYWDSIEFPRIHRYFGHYGTRVAHAGPEWTTTWVLTSLIWMVAWEPEGTKFISVIVVRSILVFVYSKFLLRLNKI